MFLKIILQEFWKIMILLQFLQQGVFVSNFAFEISDFSNMKKHTKNLSASFLTFYWASRGNIRKQIDQLFRCILPFNLYSTGCWHRSFNFAIIGSILITFWVHALKSLNTVMLLDLCPNLLGYLWFFKMEMWKYNKQCQYFYEISLKLICLAECIDCLKFKEYYLQPIHNSRKSWQRCSPVHALYMHIYSTTSPHWSATWKH